MLRTLTDRLMSNIQEFATNDTEFIAMLAHDLKTPINAQVRAMNLLYSGICGEFSPEAKNIILNVIASNKYMQSMVDNVLNRYRINSGKLLINKQNHDFRKTLEEALCNIGILSEVKEQKVVINYLSDNYIKKYDEIEIQRVLINLLSNAFQYAKENSSIEITIKNDGNRLSVLIESVLPECFKGKPFDNTDKKKLNCGLGLLICEKIILLHKGKFQKGNIENGIYKSGFLLP